MTGKKKKVSPWLLVPAGIISGYTGYLMNGAWRGGMDALEFLAAFNRVCDAPFAGYYNGTTMKAVALALAAYALAVLLYITSRRNLMPGKEFGTAKFADIPLANRQLGGQDAGYNRILSANIRMSLDTRQTGLNNNVLVIGGSGAGKTFFMVKPNLMQMPRRCSFICTDPKGEILRGCGQMLKDNGYNVAVINLLEMDQSDCYNPFSYIREETDVVRLITNLIGNTTPKGANPPDPFWEKAESLFLQSIFLYIWMEEPPERRNFGTVLRLLSEAEVADQNKPSRLDIRMKFLEGNSPLGAGHPAVKQYYKCMRGAGDTVRSIIISANSRLAFLENRKVLRILAKDEMNLAELGVGVNGDGETRTALFCVIPDSDKSYNFIIGMLYTQVFQELYYQADFCCGGRLPVHVTFMLDEFANVALPDDYCSLLSTMRSREISSVIIIQNLAQIKALFKDTWETIPGNCDTLVYLGGNEQSTHKYVSEMLGKGTIDKRSSGETRGRQGSASRNYDVLGRELLTPDEARKLDNRKCLIFIRGLDPIMDEKFIPFGHPAFGQTADGGGRPYIHGGRQPAHTGMPFRILSPKSVEYYQKNAEKGGNIYIDSMDYAEFLLLSEMGLKERFKSLDGQEQKMRLQQGQGWELEYGFFPESAQAGTEGTERPERPQEPEKAAPHTAGHEGMGAQGASLRSKASLKPGLRKQGVPAKARKIGHPETITARMAEYRYSDAHKAELKKMMAAGMPPESILAVFYPGADIGKLREARAAYESLKGQG